MVAVPVVADGRDDRAGHPEPGEARADVAGEPADGPDEAVRGGQRRSGRRWGEIDADPTDDDRLDHGDAPLAITPGA